MNGKSDILALFQSVFKRLFLFEHKKRELFSNILTRSEKVKIENSVKIKQYFFMIDKKKKKKGEDTNQIHLKSLRGNRYFVINDSSCTSYTTYRHRIWYYTLRRWKTQVSTIAAAVPRILLVTVIIISRERMVRIFLFRCTPATGSHCRHRRCRCRRRRRRHNCFRYYGHPGHSPAAGGVYPIEGDRTPGSRLYVYVYNNTYNVYVHYSTDIRYW